MAVTRGADPLDILRDRDNEIANIRAKVEWTEEFKNERIAAVHEWALREYAEAREAERERIQRRLESTKRAVFDIPTGYGSSYAEEAQIHHLFRRALAEVKAATKDPKSAQRTLDALLDQAERRGDPFLARAVYHHAIDMGDQKIELGDQSIDLGGQKIVDRFLANNPVGDKKWQAYTEAAAEAQQATSFEGRFASAMMDKQFAA
jgi:hypothetical protein